MFGKKCSFNENRKTAGYADYFAGGYGSLKEEIAVNAPAIKVRQSAVGVQKRYRKLVAEVWKG